jgi:hypothetical protein
MDDGRWTASDGRRTTDDIRWTTDELSRIYSAGKIGNYFFSTSEQMNHFLFQYSALWNLVDFTENALSWIFTRQKKTQKKDRKKPI